ncbi:PD-(D/E)XK nuclease family protein [Flavobacteriaceae bacterium R38]|nr:PD-(D/E)XK nuclease family protein [Flavobacteriaceae bacterium R38]
MKSFLQEVVDEVLEMPHELNEFVFILPSKRAGTFLKNELLKKNRKTTFGPLIYSIEDFVQELSGLKLSTNTILLFEFYQVYKEITEEEATESFYTFSKWATAILQDFNEIDRYLIPPDKIFSYLSSIKELDHWYLQEHKTDLQKNYIKFWNTLKTYYEVFSKRLLDQQIGYQGLIYKEAVENLELYIQNNSSKKYIFIGFNALNTAESTIIQEFIDIANAEVFWDIDAFFLEDKDHDAGLFLRHYKNTWKYYQRNPFKNVSNHFTQEKDIEIIGVPKNIGQAKYISKLLKELHIKNPKLNSTAVVLGNESLLIPVVNSIPEEIKAVNITSGFPLNLSPIASYFNLLFEMIENENENGWYYKYVIDFLAHPVTRTLFTIEEIDYSSLLIKVINEENIVFLSIDFIKKHTSAVFDELFSYCFFSIKKIGIQEIIKKSLTLTLKLKEIYSTEKQSNNLFLEYLYRFYELFNQIDVLNKKYGSIQSIKELKGIYKEYVLHESVDFKGEPLEGLQLMGVLESRNLDFETVIISSVNEGVLPSGKSDGSFIPFDVKNAFGLPTYKEKDAIYAYHFYHLIQRAKNVYLLYNTEPDVLEGSEKSRFLLQLNLNKQPAHLVKEIIASPLVTAQNKGIQQVTKTPLVMSALRRIAERGFSPTSLTNYIRNPIDFYYQSILGLKNEIGVEETIAANTLGTVVHNTLEELYKPLEGLELKSEMVEEMESKIEELVRKQFRKVYKSGDISRGKNLIIFNVAIKYIEKFLIQEKKDLEKGAVIKILQIESDLRVEIKIPELEIPIYLRGKVDRVDQKDGMLRIIDYKTGKVNQNDVEIIDWEVLTADYKYSKAFQVLAYAHMLKDLTKGGMVEAGIISFKNTQNGFLKFAEKDKPGYYAKKQTQITEEVHEKFLKELKVLIIEIFNPDTPFIEKEIN